MPHRSGCGNGLRRFAGAGAGSYADEPACAHCERRVLANPSCRQLCGVPHLGTQDFAPSDLARISQGGAFLGKSTLHLAANGQHLLCHQLDRSEPGFCVWPFVGLGLFSKLHACHVLPVPPGRDGVPTRYSSRTFVCRSSPRAHRYFDGRSSAPISQSKKAGQ